MQEEFKKIKTYEDACADQKRDPIASLPYPNPSNEEEEVENAFKKLLIIAKSLKGDHKPDWSNWSEPKWRPWFEYVAGSGFGFSLSFYDLVNTRSTVGSRLCFPTMEIADYFGKQFIEIHQKILNFN